MPEPADPLGEALTLFPATNACRELLAETAITIVVGETPCGNGARGCTVWDVRGPRIWLKASASAWTKTHEALHVLLECEEGDADVEHHGAVWAELAAMRGEN